MLIIVSQSNLKLLLNVMLKVGGRRPKHNFLYILFFILFFFARGSFTHFERHGYVVFSPSIFDQFLFALLFSIHFIQNDYQPNGVYVIRYPTQMSDYR